MSTTVRKWHRNRWLQLITLCFAAGIIYQLPYLRYTYYDSMMEAFHINNTQLGMIMSLFGIGCLFFYFPGGYLSDRFSQRKIMTFGQILTSLLGLIFAMFPPFPIACAISFAWSCTTAMVFWTAMISYTRTLGSDKEQGMIYGFLEAGRGIAATVLGLIIVPVFSKLGSGVEGLRFVILFWAVFGLILAVLTWFMIDDTEPVQIEKGEKGGYVAAFKNPAVWYVTIIFFATMNLFDCLGYMTPYLTSVCGLSTATAATIGTIRTWGSYIVGGILGGLIADKFTPSRTISAVSCVLIVGFVIFRFVPGNAGIVIFLVAVMLIIGIFISINRAVYWASLSEALVPMSMMGGASALVTALGGSPDAYIYTLIGYWLDKYGNDGYKFVFVYAICAAVLCLIAALLLRRYIKKQRAMAGQ